MIDDLKTIEHSTVSSSKMKSLDVFMLRPTMRLHGLFLREGGGAERTLVGPLAGVSTAMVQKNAIRLRK